MTWWTATNVAINNGQSIVNVTTGDDVQIAQEAGGLIIGNNPPVEIKRTFLDGSGNKKIELRLPWPYSNVTSQSAVAFPTDADLAEATRVLRAVGSDAVTFAEALAQVIGSTANTITVSTETSGDLSVVPYGKLTQQVQDLLNVIGDFGSPLLSSSSQNDARNKLGLAPRITTQPTLDLDFTKGDFKVYEQYGLTKKTISQAITTTRNSVATYNSPFGVATAVANEPRIEYDPATGECLGLLCEEQRTNLFLRSQELSNSSWSKLNITSYTVSEQSNGFSRISFPNTVSGIAPLVFQNVAATVGQVWALFFKVNKAFNGLRYLQIETSSGVRSLVDLETGLVVATASNVTSIVVKNGGSYWKIEIVSTALTTSERVGIMPATVATIGYNRDYQAGQWAEVTEFQLEVGSFPTSYIKTEASQVTRIADAITRNLPNIKQEATLICEFISPPINSASVGNRLISINDGTTQNRFTLTKTSNSNSMGLFAQISNSSIGGFSNSMFGTINPATKNKFGISFKDGELAKAILNGGSVIKTNSPTTLATNYTNLDIGKEVNSAYANTTLLRVRLIPRYLSDQELIDLTRL